LAATRALQGVNNNTAFVQVPAPTLQMLDALFTSGLIS